MFHVEKVKAESPQLSLLRGTAGIEIAAIFKPSLYEYDRQRLPESLLIRCTSVKIANVQGAGPQNGDHATLTEMQVCVYDCYRYRSLMWSRAPSDPNVSVVGGEIIP